MRKILAVPAVCLRDMRALRHHLVQQRLPRRLPRTLPIRDPTQQRIETSVILRRIVRKGHRHRRCRRPLLVRPQLARPSVRHRHHPKKARVIRLKRVRPARPHRRPSPTRPAKVWRRPHPLHRRRKAQRQLRRPRRMHLKQHHRIRYPVLAHPRHKHVLLHRDCCMRIRDRRLVRPHLDLRRLRVQIDSRVIPLQPRRQPRLVHHLHRQKPQLKTPILLPEHRRPFPCHRERLLRPRRPPNHQRVCIHPKRRYR